MQTLFCNRVGIPSLMSQSCSLRHSFSLVEGTWPKFILTGLELSSITYGTANILIWIMSQHYFHLLQKYPDGLVPSFKPILAEMYERCTKLALKILEAMGYALKLEVADTHVIVPCNILSHFTSLFYADMDLVYFGFNLVPTQPFTPRRND